MHNKEDIILTEAQKEIYNLYLKGLANKNSRPYNKRKDFSDIDNDIKYSLIKLDNFFKRNPEINRQIYFDAGFRCAKDTFLSLSFFHNSFILKEYSKLINERYNLDIESDSTVSDFISGLKYIVSFVKENNIKFNDYPNAVNSTGIKWMLIHLKEQKISLYHFHFFEIFLKDLGPDEILNIYLADFRNKFCDTKRQYLFSKRLKEIGLKVNTIINQKLK